MWAFFERILDSSMFAPHGICLLWEPELIWLHVMSDAVTALAYFSIPFALAIIVSKRHDFQFGWMAWAFAAFIMACGLTHVLSIYTLWVPVYGIEGILKALTALASVVTAILLWPLIPKILAIPSSAQLRKAYADLDYESKTRRGTEVLLQRFRETEATEQQIRQAQKMEALGQLTGGIAHDFNNILTVITGTIEILAAAVADRPELAEIASMIDESATRGASLTRHLLAFSRKQQLQPSNVDTNLLVKDTIKLIQPTLGDVIEIDFRAGINVSPALVDPDQLTTALLNIALNARDAMPNGGTLSIETIDTEVCEAERLDFGDIAAGKYVMISLSDTGHGISDDNLKKVFDPFFTTKEIGKGTGLGLSMVYGFIKQSRGHIGIESRLGDGTTVRILLPQALDTRDQATTESELQPIPSGSGRILVVEDDSLVRKYVLAQIKSLGYKTISAKSGPDALSILRSSELIDLLFTDVVMPGMNGRDLSVEASKLRPGLKILFTSGYTDNAIELDGGDFEMHLLMKPYRRSDLANKLWVALTEPEGLVVRKASAAE